MNVAAWSSGHPRFWTICDPGRRLFDDRSDLVPFVRERRARPSCDRAPLPLCAISVSPGGLAAVPVARRCEKTVVARGVGRSGAYCPVVARPVRADEPPTTIAARN